MNTRTQDSPISNRQTDTSKVPLLEARNATKIYGAGLLSSSGGNVALDNLSISIDTEPPVITAVVGESGSGKTTLAQLLLGMISATKGEVRYLGKNVAKMSRAEMREFRRNVQVILQDPYEVYNPFYKVDHVLETPLKKFKLANSKEEGRQRINETLRAVGLRPEETLGRYPHQLSGGQRQRIMVARALLVRPRVIIADEPVSMVDASLRATILQSLRKLTEEFRVSVIYITHDLTTAFQVSDNVIVMYRGSVAEAGQTELVVKSPQHPYTQLLVGSIPFPDPDRPWNAEDRPSEIGMRADPSVGCKFANRCPFAMDICLKNHPPLFQTDEYRVAACYLHREAEPLDGELSQVFVKPELVEAQTIAD